MKESNKYSESERLVCYKEKDGGGGIELSMIFNKEIKSVDVILNVFHRNDEPTLEPMDENTKWSAKYGRWQRETACLGVEDIDFLHHKAHELFD